MNDQVIILFYKFFDVTDPSELRDELRALAEKHNLRGRLLVAKEGINGTFEGVAADIGAFKVAMAEDDRFADMPIKESAGTGDAFPKLIVKERPEAVTLGVTGLDIKNKTATELTAEELHDWYLRNEDFVVLDLRNSYEIECGQFERTIDPGLENFRDLPDKLEEIKNLPELKDKKIVTVCTGGIRCEKATAYMKDQGMDNLYQLKDGIHTYMLKYPGQFFKGTLFVFDNRITTDVVPVPDKEIIGKCIYCGVATEHYAADDTVRPSKKIICCVDCYAKNTDKLRSISEPIPKQSENISIEQKQQNCEIVQ